MISLVCLFKFYTTVLSLPVDSTQIYNAVCFYVQWWEVVVSFVDIGGIVDN